jgi:hypothetical protein
MYTKIKNAMLILSVMFTSFACTNDDEVVYNGEQKDIEVINDGTMLKFKDQATLDRTISFLESKTEKEQEKWCVQLGFNSLNSIFADAMNEANNIETTDDYYAFKEKYGESLYFPEYDEDYGAYIPVKNKTMPNVLNSEGKVIIGNEEKCFIDIFSYEQLQDCGAAMYDNLKLRTSTSTSTSNPQRIGSNNDYVGEQYDTGWEERSNRKVKLKIGKRICQLHSSGFGYFELNYHFEVSFRKKVTLLGWVNHTCATNIILENVAIGGTTIESTHPLYTTNKSYDGHSSHDTYCATTSMCEVSSVQNSNITGVSLMYVGVAFSGRANIYYRDWGNYVKVANFILAPDWFYIAN